MAEADPIAELRSAVREAAQQLSGKGAGAEATLERPPQAEHGDYSSNAAMLLAGPLGKPPREVAEELRIPLAERLGASAEQIEVAGPGFVNLFLSERWYRQAIAGLVAAGEDAGIRPAEETERVLIEFVSANPTGPLTAAGGRHAAYGDAMARLLEAIGHDVGREYYSNDIGGQMDRFGKSIAAAIAGAEPPEDGYEGAYVAELGERLAAEGVDASDPDALAKRGAELMLESIRETLLRYGVEFDTWSSQRSFEESGAVEAVIEELRKAGKTFESEGALWLRTTEFGDDKDRVLLRSDGEPTYFASDIAYHRDKLGRGFEHLIDVLGADHHGYLERMRAALQALGFDGEVFEAQIMQFVHIVERGERTQMSKAPRRFRHPRRAARRHRGRRDALLHAPAQPRQHRRPRPRAGPRASRTTTRSTTCSTRTPASPASCARRARRESTSTPRWPPTSQPWRRRSSQPSGR